MKLASLSHKIISQLTLKKPNYQYKSLTSTTHYNNLSINTEPSIASIATNPCISLLGICKNLSSLKKIHALFIVHGGTKDFLIKIKLISLYGSFGHVNNARILFDEMPNPDFYSFKVMIRWYSWKDLYNEVIGFYGYMRKVFNDVDNVVFSIVLKACTKLHDVDEGRKLHGHLVKVGGADSFVLIGLVDMYAKCGEIEISRKIFDGIVDRNVVCWTSMIVGYVQNDCAEEGLALFNRMRDELVKGNEYTLGSVVSACTKLEALHQGKWVHGYMIKKGIAPNCHLVTSLVDMYVKCWAIADARLVFDEFCVIDLVTWTAMIVGYARGGHPDEALKLFVDKEWQAVLPNSITIASVLSACAQLCNLKMGVSVHSLGIKLGLKDITVSNALLDMYGKCGKIGDAQYLFETATAKDVVSWNTMVIVYSSKGLNQDALKLFHKMRLENVQPDSITIVAVLSACSNTGMLKVGSCLHAYSIKGGLFKSNVYVGTALLNFYAKCGDANSARIVFDGMADRNTATWSAMIGGYGVQGDTINSLALLSDMMKERLEPNDIIFTTILSACSHTGMIEEGWRFFDRMCREYHLVPSVKHYVCMVDLLSRAGRLEEAWDFISKMPVQPDVTLFVAFLQGCSIHSRYDLAEVAIGKMRDMYLNDSSHYVLLSNLYASEERWSQAYKLRESMKAKGLRKCPGCSEVDINLSDASYPQRIESLA